MSLTKLHSKSLNFKAFGRNSTLSLCCALALAAPTAAFAEPSENPAPQILTANLASQTAYSNTLATQSRIQQGTEQAEQTFQLDAVNVSALKMSSRLDELNRNVYQVSSESIKQKGFVNTESVFRYLPFASISNLGLGGNIDLRGQGNKANTSVQTLINGVYANMLDSSHGVTPINTISPNLIQEIEILPGGGAVMFGNGTRGGVVNIITTKRFETPYFSVSAGYANVSTTTPSSNFATAGSNYSANVLYGDKFGENLHLNVGASYLYKGSAREGERTVGGGVNFGILYDFASGQSVNFDADFYHANMHTSPFNSFMDTLPAGSEPSKNERKRSGNGAFHNTQNRFTTNLGYESEVSEDFKWNLRAFYHYNRLDYKDSLTRLSTYAYGSGARSFTFIDAQADQSGSLFDDQKVGLEAKFDLKHDSGRFIAGLQSLYQMSKRTMNQHITTPNAAAMGAQQVKYDHAMHIPFVGNKWTNSIFAIEKYDFTEWFSLTGGGRYEFARYFIDVKNSHKINVNMGARAINQNYTTPGSLTQNLHNFALELTPSVKFSPTGALYAKYERGYLSPSPNNTLKREGTGSANYRYEATNLKRETYDTFELGARETFGGAVLLSGAVFYTATRNEFYTIGNAHSVDGVRYGTYDKTRRLGVEVASEQYLFGGILGFNESFTYVKAEKKDAGKWGAIPNTYNYKGTLGASLEIAHSVGFWVQSAFVGRQQVVSKTAAGVDEDRALKAYALVDLGVSGSFGGFSLSAGVRNIADTLYYDYYNHDASDTIAGYGYLVGQGRTFFVEGKYEF